MNEGRSKSIRSREFSVTYILDRPLSSWISSIWLSGNQRGRWPATLTSTMGSTLTTWPSFPEKPATEGLCMISLQDLFHNPGIEILTIGMVATWI